VTVPFLDVAAAARELRAELDAAYARVMDSGRYILGEEVEAFERELAAVAGTAHAVGTGNGLDALEIALRACGVQPGDEVIVPAHTFVATWLAVTRCGATVVPVDVEERSLLIDPVAAAAAAGPRTAAIVTVDLYGRPVDPAPFLAVAERHGAILVEDAAQAHGASLDGRPAGSLGHAAAFSFYPAKNLGAYGDAGALTSGDAAVAERARRLRNYGSTERYVHDDVGANSRLDPLQAAFLRVKLAALARWNTRRAEIAAAYLEALGDVPELVLPEPASEGVVPSWHLFCVRHPRRDALQEHLRERGVETLIHYPVPPHRSGAYAALGWPDGAFPVAEAACATLLSLPMGPHLGDAGVAQVIEAVRAF
jgi:dTDP-3-amino-3,4,6-trideoxy-alpha-D-glucose transaminase